MLYALIGTFSQATWDPRIAAGLCVFLLNCLITQGDATGHLLQHGAQSRMVPAIAAKATATAQTVRTVPRACSPAKTDRASVRDVITAAPKPAEPAEAEA
jgi:hypothetical protein